MRKKTIKIPTLNGYYNYSNRLQLFALARKLRKFGLYTLLLNVFCLSEVQKTKKQIVGFGQVWNPNYRWLNSIDLLSFASPQKRIDFSASYGVSEITQEYASSVSKGLKQIKHSFRYAIYGKVILKDICG